MIFELKEKSGYVPDLCYGDRGKELECFVPDGCQWVQVEYGQGEGQVLIDGCEWGFYYSDKDSVSIVLHKGSLDLDMACNFVNKVKEKIYGDKGLTVQALLVGTEGLEG